MPFADTLPPAGALRSFVALCGEPAWNRRVAELCARAQPGSLLGRIAQQRHALELALARIAGRAAADRAGAVDRLLCLLAQEAVEMAAALPAESLGRLREEILAGLTGEATLIPLFHRLRTAALLRGRGFALRFEGIAEGAAHDLLAEREGEAMEVACETISAEAGRKVNRGDWWMLVDRVHPELQTWLAAHPGRYLLKMTLPEGLAGPDQTAEIHQRITALLAAERRQGACSQAVLKLDPLVLAGAQVMGERSAGGGLPARLREQFGPEAHLAVTTSPGSKSVFVMAARASQENEVAAAVCRRLERAARDPPERPPPRPPRGVPRRPRPDRMAPAAGQAGAGRRRAPLPHHRRGAARRCRVLRVPLRAVRRAAAGRRRRRRAPVPQPGAPGREAARPRPGDPVVSVMSGRAGGPVCRSNHAVAIAFSRATK